MPVLPLSPEAIQSPKPFDAAVLRAIMLYPNDPELQHLVMRSFVRDANIADWEFELSQNPDATIRLDRAVDILRLTRSAVSVESEPYLAGKPYAYGMTAGVVLIEALTRRARASNRSSLSAIYQDVSVRIKTRFKVPEVQSISPDTIEKTIWPEFRQVAHLWAAYIAFLSSFGETYPPCLAHQVPKFLSVSQQLLDEALQSRGPQSKTFLIQTSESWVLPREWILPASPLPENWHEKDQAPLLVLP